MILESHAIIKSTTYSWKFRRDATSCNADKIDESTLDEIIKSFVKNDKHGKEEVTHNETLNVCSNNKEAKDEDNDNDLSKNEESSCESDNDEYDHDDYDYNSDSDDEHSECPSDYDEWAKWNEERWKHKKKVKSHSD